MPPASMAARSQCSAPCRCSTPTASPSASLARDARVVLVALGAGDAAVREISTDPDAPGLASLAAGQASFSGTITRDIASNLNLIAAGRNASRGSLLAAPGIMRTFEALTQAYPHLVVDGGALGGSDGEKEIEAIARIATHALLLVETAAGLATAQARDSLLLLASTMSPS
jgi:hypothetical protein